MLDALLRRIFARPTKCSACGRKLYPRRKYRDDNPVMYCPGASIAFGAKLRHGYLVVECDY